MSPAVLRLTKRQIPARREPPGAARSHAGSPGGGPSFVGREDELAQLFAIATLTRALTLVGPGGVGKSRLAQRLAVGLSTQFRDGAHVVDVAAVGASGGLMKAVTDRLGKHRLFSGLSGGPLSEQLASREMLLILDNCDPAVTECAELAAALLSMCPGVHILATGRGPLQIDGEVVWRVPTLRLPSADANRADEVQDSAAVKLLVARLRGRIPGFTFNVDTARPIAHICRRVDGLPLALEIVAMHVPGIGLTNMAARLDAAYALRLRGSSDAPLWQQSLRASVDASYALLNDYERMLFRRLSTFVGGWTLDAAEVVCSDEHLFRSSVPALLDALVSRSLVMLDNEGPSTRFHFMGIVRQYAFELLRESGEADRLRCRHAAYIATLCWRVHPAELDAGHVAAMAAELGNVRAALRWALRAPDPDLAFKLAIAGYTFWYLPGRFPEGAAWLARCVALPTGDSLRGRRAAVRCLAGHLALLSGHVRRARALLDEALSAQRQLGDAEGITLALHFLSLVELWRGRLEQARELCDESQRALEQVSGDGQLARLLRSAVPTVATRIAFERGDQRRAADLSTWAVSFAQRQGSRFWHARAQHLQALIAARAGQTEAGIELIERSIESQRTISDSDGLVDSLCTLGQLRLDSGSRREGLDALIEALGLARMSGQRLGVVWALEGVAQALSSTRPEDAVRLAASCRALRIQLGCAPWPAQRRRRLGWQVRVRSELGSTAFHAAGSTGRGWGLPEAVRLVTSIDGTPSDSSPTPNPLTPRERDVTRLLVQDLSNSQISAALGISVGTVRSHVDHILAKLGLHSRAQLAVWALQDEGQRSLGATGGNLIGR